MGDEPVQVGVGGARQAKVLHGKLVDSLMEKEKFAVYGKLYNQAINC